MVNNDNFGIRSPLDLSRAGNNPALSVVSLEKVFQGALKNYNKEYQRSSFRWPRKTIIYGLAGLGVGSLLYYSAMRWGVINIISAIVLPFIFKSQTLRIASIISKITGLSYKIFGATVGVGYGVGEDKEYFRNYLNRQERIRIESLTQSIFDRCSTLIAFRKTRRLQNSEVSEINQLYAIFSGSQTGQIIFVRQDYTLILRRNVNEGERGETSLLSLLTNDQL